MWVLVPQTKVPPRPRLVRICVLLNTCLDMCLCTHTEHVLTHSHVDMNSCTHACTHTLGMCSHSHRPSHASQWAELGAQEAG